MHAPTPILRLIGWRPTGDIGPWTCYTSQRNIIVFFPKSPPEKPPSPFQVTQRNLFRSAAILWQSLPESQRQDWARAARRANLRITGYNLFTHYVLRPHERTIETIERQTSIQLLPLSRDLP